MIEAPIPNPENSYSDPARGCQGHESGNHAQCFCRATEDAVGSTNKRFDESTNNRLRPRPTLFRIVMLAVCSVILAGAARFALISPLETRLLAEQAQSLVKDLDALVAVRGAAINMAAGNLDIDNLSASGGLEKLLTTLRTVLPDFSSLEIINDQGQTVAMMGNVALSFIGQPVDREALAGIDSKDPSQKVLFFDDPGNQGFFIILTHSSHDGREWFSRTRFAHKSIDLILKSAGADLSAALLPLAPDAAKESVRAAGVSTAGASGNTSVKRNQVTTTKQWWGEASGAEALLGIPGWRLSIEKKHPSLVYFAQVLIPGLVVFLIGLVYSVARPRSRGEENQPTSVATVMPPTDAETKSDDELSVAQPATEKDPTPSDEKESIVVTDAAETARAEPWEDEVFEVPSEPCEEAACPQETESEDEIPETLEVTWFETVSVLAGEVESFQQEPAKSDTDTRQAMILPQISA